MRPRIRREGCAAYPCEGAVSAYRIRPRGLYGHRHEKAFPVWIDETAQLFDRIYVSGGKIGCQLHLAPDDLARAANASYADLTE